MDKPAPKNYFLSLEYLCRIKEKGEKQQSRIIALFKHVVEDENVDEYTLELLCELYFLNCKLKEELLRYDLQNCDEEKKDKEFSVTETDIFILRTILLSKHSAMINLANKNISVREN